MPATPRRRAPNHPNWFRSGPRARHKKTTCSRSARPALRLISEFFGDEYMTQVQSNYRHRANLGRVKTAVEIPNLIDIQKTSYDKFLQSDILGKDRRDVGLQ